MKDNKSNWVLYPYNKNYDWVFEVKDFAFIDKFTAIVPRGWEIIEKDNPRIKNDDCFDEVLEMSTGLWLVDSKLSLDFVEHIVPKIKKTVRSGKKVFCSRKLSTEEKMIVNEIVPDSQWFSPELQKCTKSTKNTIYDIDTPIVYLVGMISDVNQIDNLFHLKKSFESYGYSVAAFSDAKEVIMQKGCHWLYAYADEYYDQTQRAILANHYVKQIEVNDNPDLIIIEIQEGISVLGRTFIENMGIEAYSIAKVIRPDCVILNIIYGNYEMRDVEALGDEIRDIIGEGIDCYNIVNRIVDFNMSDIKNEICSIEIDTDLAVKKALELESNKIYCLKELNAYKYLTEQLINQLEENAVVLSV